MPGKAAAAGKSYLEAAQFAAVVPPIVVPEEKKVEVDAAISLLLSLVPEDKAEALKAVLVGKPSAPKTSKELQQAHTASGVELTRARVAAEKAEAEVARMEAKVVEAKEQQALALARVAKADEQVAAAAEALRSACKDEDVDEEDAKPRVDGAAAPAQSGEQSPQQQKGPPFGSGGAKPAVQKPAPAEEVPMEVDADTQREVDRVEEAIGQMSQDEAAKAEEQKEQEVVELAKRAFVAKKALEAAKRRRVTVAAPANTGSG